MRGFRESARGASSWQASRRSTVLRRRAVVRCGWATRSTWPKTATARGLTSRVRPMTSWLRKARRSKPTGLPCTALNTFSSCSEHDAASILDEGEPPNHPLQRTGYAGRLARSLDGTPDGPKGAARIRAFPVEDTNLCSRRRFALAAALDARCARGGADQPSSLVPPGCPRHLRVGARERCLVEGLRRAGAPDLGGTCRRARRRDGALAGARDAPGPRATIGTGRRSARRSALRRACCPRSRRLCRRRS
jgi:hypothetical protein